MGLFTNAFLVETPNHVVAVDALMTLSDARSLRKRLDSIGKPLAAVIITHGHPDHYNGVTELIRPGDQTGPKPGNPDPVPIIATRGVERVIHRTDDAKEKKWKPVYGDDWPRVRTFPNRLVSDGDTLLFDRISFTVRELGPAESHCDTYWRVEGDPPIVFVGDLVFNGVHSFMNDGHTQQWLYQLDTLQNELSDVGTVYTGHGRPGSLAEVLKAQREYILHYRETVRALAQGSTALSEEAKKSLVREMKTFLPTDDLDLFIAAGADPVAAELAAEET